MRHPAKKSGNESPAFTVTLGLGADGARGAELHLPVHHFAPTRAIAARRHADVHMRMPLRKTERNAGVELVRRRILSRDVHRTDERVASVGPTLVQQRAGLPRVERAAFPDGASIVGEVVDLHGDVRQEDLVAVLDRLPIVTVWLDAFAHASQDLFATGAIASAGRAHRRQLEVRSLHDRATHCGSPPGGGWISALTMRMIMALRRDTARE